MADLPVVVVVATCGKDRIELLLNRALSSIKKQTRKANLVVVVSDNDPLDDFLDEDEIKGRFDANFRDNVLVIPNSRTRKNSGTGPWNTGILEAFSLFGEECWVAILDDDDEWEDNHIEACLEAASGNCMWVVSGIERVSSSGRRKENLLVSTPSAGSFLTTNPGIQGSNLFVKVSALLGEFILAEFIC